MGGITWREGGRITWNGWGRRRSQGCERRCSHLRGRGEVERQVQQVKGGGGLVGPKTAEGLWEKVFFSTSHNATSPSLKALRDHFLAYLALRYRFHKPYLSI